MPVILSQIVKQSWGQYNQAPLLRHHFSSPFEIQYARGKIIPYLGRFFYSGILFRLRGGITLAYPRATHVSIVAMILVSITGLVHAQEKLPPLPGVRVPAGPIMGVPEHLRELLKSAGTPVKGVQSLEILTPAQPVGSSGATLVCRQVSAVDTGSNYIHFGLTGPPRAAERPAPPPPSCSVTFQPALVGDYYALVFTLATNEEHNFMVDGRTAPRQAVDGRPAVGSQVNRYAQLVGPASAKRNPISVQVNMSFDEAARMSRTYRDSQWYFLSVEIMRVIR